MTSRERLLAALAGESVDYVPCSASFNPLTDHQQKQHGWNFPWSQSATLEQRLAYQVENLGLDQTVRLSINLCRPDPGVSSKTWLDGDILHKTFTTPAGDLHASVQCNELWPYEQDIPLYDDFNVGHFVEPWIQNEDDLKCLMHVQRLSDSNETISKAENFVNERLTLAKKYNLATVAQQGEGLTGAMKLMGAQQVCTAVLDNPSLVHAFLDYENEINLRSIELFGKLGVDIILRNGFYETTDFYSPAMLEQFIAPLLRKETDAIHNAKMHASYTVHSGVMQITDHLASLNMDSLFGIDIAFQGFDLAKFRDNIAASSIKNLWIGPSSTHHLWAGEEATRNAVTKVFDTLGKRGLILSPCVSAHSIMPWKSTLAMIDQWKQLK